MGDRDRLIFLPGLATTGRLFEAEIAALSPFAEASVADTTRHDNLPEMAAEILASAPPCFALCGLSMGGYLAFEVIRQAPDRVERLALLDTQARPDTPEATAKRLRLIGLAKSGAFEEALTELGWQNLVATTRSSDDSLEAIIYGMAEEIGPEAFVRQERAIIARADSRPLLPMISCPTLVLVGDDDRITPPPLAQEMAAAIPRARLVEVPDCGHLSALERPEAVSEALREWLRGGGE
jgi:pimeloyl-ACP methyl ester carboxylesterase